MITTALFLAVLVTVGFAILFYKLPNGLRKFLAGNYILLDIFLCWVVFTAFGFAMVGIMAAGFIALFVSIYLFLYKKGILDKEPPKPKKTLRQKTVYSMAFLYNRLKKDPQNADDY